MPCANSITETGDFLVKGLHFPVGIPPFLPKMGASLSHSLEIEEARKSFSEHEMRKLVGSFEKIASHDGENRQILTVDPFQSFTSWLLPAQVSQRFYKEMTNIQKSLGQDIPEDHVSIDAYIVTMSHMFKKGRDQKAHIFYLVASDSNTVNSSDVATLCSLFLNAYTIALESTSVGAKWKLKSTPQDSERFVQMAMKELLGSKKQPCELTTEDLIAWFSRFPLIEHLFSAIIRACFIDLESIVEEHPHGLSEGCEETIGHIQYDRSHILVPCKLQVDFSKIDTLLDLPSILVLNHNLPSNLRHSWRLLFSTKKHGESFHSFVHKITHQGPTLLVVRDEDGHVFGGFASQSWAIKSHFDGDSHCFLFSLHPSLALYHPTGYNENYMYLNMNMQTLPNGLGMGGQYEYFGLWLQDSFGPGHCRGDPCTTYGNPQLSGKEKFKIDVLEVWGVGVPPEAQAREHSVLDTEVEAKAFLEITGKEMHSEGYREPEPMNE
ncbi:MTOR-associated protein MEAK7 [Nematostella vectensis]|uniref:MTOR-associated protein MEAK7 n=1 Tax=Nematostella vectensis TaxID=45351 RepID=UPI00207789A4|nr:MTOR-associated protein MEAK7 [Nematostella vectensis]